MSAPTPPIFNQGMFAIGPSSPEDWQSFYRWLLSVLTATNDATQTVATLQLGQTAINAAIIVLQATQASQQADLTAVQTQQATDEAALAALTEQVNQIQFGPNPFIASLPAMAHRQLQPTGMMDASRLALGSGPVDIESLAGPITFGLNLVEKMRLHTNGFFGIMQPSPAYQLDIVGDVNTTTLYRAATLPGISGTAVLAKITGAGTNGSLTITGGIITAKVDPT